MFTRLKNAFLGRNENRMSRKAREEIDTFVRTEFRDDVEFATYMAKTGQLDKLRAYKDA